MSDRTPTLGLEARRTRLLSQLALAWLALLLGALALLYRDQPAALAALALGLAPGWALAAALSRPRNELALVPFAALALLPALHLLSGLAREEAALHEGLATLAAVGVLVGAAARPLALLVRERAGRVSLAWLGVFLLAGLGWSLTLERAGLDRSQCLLVMNLSHAAVSTLTLALMPEFLMRFLVFLLVHLFYRVRAQGLEHIPAEGAAIVTCNHVSYVDALLLGSLSQRPIRFVMDHRIFQIPLLSFVFRTARAIPIAPAREDAALLARAYAEIDLALANGELLGLFPEGALTPDGAIQPFKPGIDKILARRPVPVVPMALKGLWQSMWSRRDSRLGRLRLPRRFRARVALVVAAPLAPGTVDAAQLEARIRALRGDAA
ncbi:MAG TPA: 1-acyl-sn-glycerol-3-phosphate acyltransferase [Nevskiaceae bacterium]|nr:1-acyl-sn-glycerol-3-phosphate acyltransferase [Nevskiaceae bacterium]